MKQRHKISNKVRIAMSITMWVCLLLIVILGSSNGIEKETVNTVAVAVIIDSLIEFIRKER